MAVVKGTSAALAKIAKEREALKLQAAALDAQERQMRKDLSVQGARRLSEALSKLDLGEVTKAQATQFARHVQRLGLAQTLDRLLPE